MRQLQAGFSFRTSADGETLQVTNTYPQFPNQKHTQFIITHISHPLVLLNCSLRYANAALSN